MGVQSFAIYCPEASKYTVCSLKVSGTVSSKEAEEVWYPASFLEQDSDPWDVQDIFV